MRIKNQVRVFSDYEQTSFAVAKKIADVIQEYPTGLYCFAGGDTPLRALDYLVSFHEQGLIDLRLAHYIQLDEWVGISRENSGSCYAYLNEHLYTKAQIDHDHIHAFNVEQGDSEAACRTMDTVMLEQGPLACGLLGVGVNGHLGFNEPHCRIDAAYHVVNLSATTLRVGKKYFGVDEVVPTQGVTLGLRQLLAAKYLLIEAVGPAKHTAIAHLLSHEVDMNWPVTAVTTHDNCFVFLDAAARG